MAGSGKSRLLLETGHRRLTIVTREAAGENARREISYQIPGKLVRTMMNNLASQYKIYEIVPVYGERNLMALGDVAAQLHMEASWLSRLLHGDAYIAFLPVHPSLLNPKAITLSKDEKEELKELVDMGILTQEEFEYFVRRRNVKESSHLKT